MLAACEIYRIKMRSYQILYRHRLFISPFPLSALSTHPLSRYISLFHSLFACLHYLSIRFALSGLASSWVDSTRLAGFPDNCKLLRSSLPIPTNIYAGISCAHIQTNCCVSIFESVEITEYFRRSSQHILFSDV